MRDLRSIHHLVSICRYQVVFCPTYRRTLVTPLRDEPLNMILTKQRERWGRDLVELEVLTDHVHLLLGSDPQLGIHRLVQLLKGHRSHALHAEFPALQRRLPSRWTTRYCVSFRRGDARGGVMRDALQRYVELQKGR